MSSPVVPSAYFRKLAHSAGASDAHFRKPSYNPLPTRPTPTHPPDNRTPYAEREDSEDSYSELDEDAYAKAVAELPRPTSSRKLERSPLRKAAPLPPPHGSGGPFYRYELPRDVLIRVLSDSIGSPKDYAHVSRACLQFNDAAVGKGVLAAVVSVAPYERGGVATTMARQAQDQAVAAGKTGKTKRRESSSNTVRHYSGIGAGVVLVVRRTCGR